MTIDEVYDFENFLHTPRVYTDYDKAKADFEDIKEDAKREFADDFNEIEEGKDYFEMYAEGYYSEGHYTIRIDEVEVE